MSMAWGRSSTPSFVAGRPTSARPTWRRSGRSPTRTRSRLTPCDLRFLAISRPSASCAWKRTRPVDTLPARDLAQDLDRFLDGKPTRARPPGRLEHLRRRARRNPSAAILFSISTLLAVTILGGIFWFRSRLDETWNLAGRREAEAVRRDRYVTDIRQAGQAVRDHQTARAVDLLAKYRPAEGETDLRGFGWYHLMDRCHTERLTLTGHEATSTMPSSRRTGAWSPRRAWTGAYGSGRPIRAS